MIKYKRILNFLAVFMIFGKIVSADILNFDLFNGSGKFINAKGGTITTPDNDPYEGVVGTLYVSGDFGEDDYSDSVQSDTIFNALDFDGTVISVSPVYNAEIASNLSSNEFYFTLTRNNFDEGVIENKELGRVLEAGYFDDESLLKDQFYNEIKNFSSNEELNSAVEDTFGVNFTPLITKQTQEIINDATASAMDSVSYIDKDLPTGYRKMLADYRINRVKINGKDNFEGYQIESSTISFGIEEKINSNFKRGTIFTIIESSTDMDNHKGGRDDFLYQGSFYGVYEVDSVIYSSMLSFGGSDTDIYRYNNSTLGDFVNVSNLNNFYLGLNNSVYKEYQVGKLNITPKAELNLIWLNQGEINENGDYGLEIDRVKILSVKPGIGFNIQREFHIADKTKLSIEADIMNYIDVVDPYKDLEVKLKTVSPEKGTIESYSSDMYHLDLSFKQSLKNSDYLSFSLMESYIFSDNQKQFKLELQFSYIF
jgi:hypothetical protein